VSAHETEAPFVDVFGCTIFVDGKWVLDGPTDVNLGFRWGSKTRLQGLKFLERVRPVVKIDGTTVAHPNQYWDVPVHFGEDLWVTTWTYPAERLSIGESFVVKMQIKLSERVWDGDRWWKAGRLFESPLECKVKAT
jgi:hypothetical protein